MAGSAPEGALAVPSIGPDAIDSVWGSFTEPDLPTRARQRESAMKTLWASETALTVLSAQEVAVRVREEHPDAVGLRISESWEPGATSWALDSVVLADGSALQVSDELTDDIATPVSDIRPEGNEPGSAVTVSSTPRSRSTKCSPSHRRRSVRSSQMPAFRRRAPLRTEPHTSCHKGGWTSPPSPGSAQTRLARQWLTR